MGRPKALVELDGEPLVRRALAVLADGGCTPRLVVLGAAADEVRELLPGDVTPVVATDWALGMSASLRAGLAALAGLAPAPDAVVVHLVDLPGVTAEVVRRLAALTDPQVLARAAYSGVAGHPVLVGRAHWSAIAGAATGDAGARRYLSGHPSLRLVECGDVAVADDVDTAEQLRVFRAGQR